MWRLEDNLWHLLCPPARWVPGIKLRLPGLVISPFTYWIIPMALFLTYKLWLLHIGLASHDLSLLYGTHIPAVSGHSSNYARFLWLIWFLHFLSGGHWHRQSWQEGPWSHPSAHTLACVSWSICPGGRLLPGFLKTAYSQQTTGILFPEFTITFAGSHFCILPIW